MRDKATVFVSSFEEADLYRKSYSKTTKRAALGLQVIPFLAWLQDQWDIWGDSRRLISPLERTILVSKVVREHGGIASSEGAVQLFSRYIYEVAGSTVFENALNSLDSYEGIVREVLEIVASYKKTALAHHFIEAGEAFAFLPTAAFSCSFSLSESFVPPFFLQEFIDAHRDMFSSADKAAKGFTETIIKPLPEDISVEFLFPSGATSQGSLLAERIESWLSDAIQKQCFSNVLLLCATPLELFDTLLPRMQSREINAAVSGIRPFAETLFGKSYFALHAFFTDHSFSALSDYLKSPYSGASIFDSYQINSLLRSEKRFDDKEIREVIEKKASHFSYAEELFETIDASLILDYFKDVAIKCFAHDEALLQEEIEAISSLRSLYEAARMFNSSIEEVSLFAESLTVRSRKIIDANQPVQVLFATHHEAFNVTPQGFNTVVMCDLDVRFFSSSDVFAAFLHIDEALGISFAESFLREQRVMMMQAERCAFERFACEQVLVSPEGEETYPAFFFDELLSFYEKEGSEEPFSLDAERCFVFQRGEEYLFDNLLIQEESEGASLCAEAAGKSKELPVLVVPKVIRGMLSEDAKSNLILPRTQLHYCKPIQAVSPSDIEAYVMCPYRWFIERRINPKKLDFERGSLEQGVFVHEMFADLYRIMKEDYSLSRVTEANFEQVSEIFNTLFEQKLKEQTEDDSAHYVLESELDIIEGEHLKETLLASLEQQARMLPSYVPACHERALTVSDGILYAGVPLIGRVDRVDVSSDGKNFVVFDYKGNIANHKAGYNPDKQEFSLPQKIQALIYAQALRKIFPDKTCSGALYLSYRSMEDSETLAGSYNESVLDLSSFAKKTSVVAMNFGAYLDLVEEALVPYLKRMFSGDIAPNPCNSKACTYCSVANCDRKCQ